ncbi:uncharacterized protein LOC129590312 isoform X2 [Paramacrobiotus metropolitanus]|nr:uncharacterized protein LOC129590312 isoform X2 [Paramacrobiotus metropolitanus]
MAPYRCKRLSEGGSRCYCSKSYCNYSAQRAFVQENTLSNSYVDFWPSDHAKTPLAARQTVPTQCYKCHTRYHDSMCDASLDPTSGRLPPRVNFTSNCLQGCSVTRYFVTNLGTEGHLRSCAGDTTSPIVIPDSIPETFNYHSWYLCKKWTAANVRYITCHCVINGCNKDSATTIKYLNFTAHPDNVWFAYNPRNMPFPLQATTSIFNGFEEAVIDPTTPANSYSRNPPDFLPPLQADFCYECLNRSVCNDLLHASHVIQKPIECVIKSCRVEYWAVDGQTVRGCSTDPSRTTTNIAPYGNISTPHDYLCIKRQRYDPLRQSMATIFECHCSDRWFCNSQPAAAFDYLWQNPAVQSVEWNEWFGFTPRSWLPTQSPPFTQGSSTTTANTPDSKSPVTTAITEIPVIGTTKVLDYATSIAPGGFKREADQCYRCTNSIDATDPFCDNLLTLGSALPVTAACVAKSCSVTWIVGVGLTRDCSYIVPGMEGTPFGDVTTSSAYLCRRLKDLVISGNQASAFECHCFNHTYCNAHPESAFLDLSKERLGYTNFLSDQWFGFEPHREVTRSPPPTTRGRTRSTKVRLNYATLLPSVPYVGSADTCYRCQSIPTCSDLLHSGNASSTVRCAARSCSVTYFPGVGLTRDCSYIHPGMEDVPFGDITTGLTYMCKRLKEIVVTGNAQVAFECHCSNQAYCNVHPETSFLDLVNAPMYQGFPVDEWFGYDPLGPFITPSPANATHSTDVEGNSVGSTTDLPSLSSSTNAAAPSSSVTASAALFQGNAAECHRCVTVPACNDLQDPAAAAAERSHCAAKSCSVTYIADFGLTRECSFLTYGVEGVPFGNVTTRLPYICKRFQSILVLSGNTYTAFECHCFDHPYCNGHPESSFVALTRDPTYIAMPDNQWFGYDPSFDSSSNSSAMSLETLAAPVSSPAGSEVYPGAPGHTPPDSLLKWPDLILRPTSSSPTDKRPSASSASEKPQNLEANASSCYQCLEIPTCNDLSLADDVAENVQCPAKTCSVTYVAGVGLTRGCSDYAPEFQGAVYNNVTADQTYLCRRLNAVMVGAEAYPAFECWCWRQASCNEDLSDAFTPLKDNASYLSLTTGQWFAFTPVDPLNSYMELSISLPITPHPNVNDSKLSTQRTTKRKKTTSRSPSSVVEDSRWPNTVILVDSKPDVPMYLPYGYFKYPFQAAPAANPQPAPLPSPTGPFSAASDWCFSIGSLMSLCWNENFPYFSYQRAGPDMSTEA